MKFRKLISVLIASAMLISLVSISASAAVVFEYDDGYYIDNVMDVSERTPYIQTSVTQLSSEQVVALNGGTSGLSDKKLTNKAGKFGDTTTWTVYRIDGVFKEVEELGAGYDRDDNTTAYIKLKALDATMDFSSIAELGAENSNWYVSVDETAEATLGVAWTLQSDGTKRGVAINLETPYPAGSKTAEGALIDVDYSFTMYLVVPAGTSKTISYAAANASVQYWVGNAEEGVSSQLVENKVASRSPSFAIAEGSTEPEPEDEIKEADTGYELQNKYVKNTETPLKDLQGRDVELSKNYGIAKFTETIDTTAKNYFLHVVDDKEESADLPINFADQGFDFDSATVSFFAIVRSATHKVVSMTLKAVAKSE